MSYRGTGTVYVFRNGELVEKGSLEPEPRESRSDFPTPMIQPHFADMESPVTGKVVGSWKERERDMRAVDAVDARDVPRGPIEKRKKDRARPDSAPFEWGRLDRL
jgi:hypothetical protein